MSLPPDRETTAASYAASAVVPYAPDNGRRQKQQKPQAPLPLETLRDLEVVFEYYAAFGTGRSRGMTTKGEIRMDNRQFVKCCRETGLLQGGRLISSRLDLIFTKICGEASRAAAREAELKEQEEDRRKNREAHHRLPPTRLEARRIPKKVDFSQFIVCLQQVSRIVRRKLVHMVQGMVTSGGGAEAAQVSEIHCFIYAFRGLEKTASG